MNLIKNHKLLILAIFLAVASYIYILLVGDTYILTFEMEQMVDEDAEITAEVADDSPGSAEVLDVYRDGNDICVKLHGGESGRIYVMIYYDNQYQDMEVLFVHNGHRGYCRTAGSLQVCHHLGVEGENGACGSDLGPHVADRGLAGTGYGLGTFAEILDDSIGAALDGQDAGEL